MFLSKRQKYRSLDDKELVQLFKEKREQLCIGILFERYGKLVMGACLKYVKDEFDAQEISSKIFEELPDKIQNFEIQFFKSWLYQVTRNECLQFLRKQDYSFLHLSTIENLVELNTIDASTKEIQLQQLEQAISELNELQKSCIQLFYLEDKSYTEISTLLKIELKMVKSALQNGKRMLKLNLESKIENHESNK